MPSPAVLRDAGSTVGSRDAGDTPVQIDRLADGTLIAHLDERWADFAVVRLGPDGKPAWTCVSGPAAAAQFVATPVIILAPTTVKREEK
jgi:hypothetical protein